MYSIQQHEYIFSENVPFETCHASTLLLTKESGLLCAWFGGTKEGSDDVDIWISRKAYGKWQQPVKISDEQGVAHWNPVLYRLSNGDIVLFYKVGRQISSWYTKVKISRDEGYTWSNSVELVKGDRGGRGPVRNKPIQLSNGWIAAPGSTENGIWEAFVDISKDDGKTWEKHGGIGIQGISFSEHDIKVSDIPVTQQSFKGRGVIQPTLWESHPGCIHMLLRSSEGRIYRSDSADYGLTWCDAYPTSLPNNNSGIDLTKLEDGRLVLAYNPVGENWGVRTPMVLAVSSDNGITWTDIVELDSGDGEFSYPAIISQQDCVHVSYTWNRKNIAYWKIKIH